MANVNKTGKDKQQDGGHRSRSSRENMAAMSVGVVDVPSEDAKRVLAYEEGHFLDLKAIDVAPGKLTRAMSAFANADGGELYIGIAEDAARTRQWRGFSAQEDANGFLQAFEEFFPLSRDFSYEFLQVPGSPGYVLHVYINKTRDIRLASDGKAYVRRGAQSLPVTNAEGLEILRRAKGITSFETQTVAVPIEFVTNSETIIEFLLGVVPTGEPDKWLRKQLLILDERPTVACLLLFADEPQVALPKRSAIKVYRYKTMERVGSRETLAFDPITIEGCIYNQIRDAVAKTVSLIQGVRVLGPEGLQEINYPLETLHEIITNAVIHRDYGIADDVHVRIFDNRVEVESPGRLPAHITVANILDERFARNGAIVRLINKFPDPPNKDVGEGLNTAFAAMKRLQLKDPEIKQLENSVLVNIKHERLASPEELILEYLETHEEINNRTVRDLTGIGSENKVKVIFQRLMAASQIERVPGKGGGSAAYRKCADSESDNE
ncbi:ATP-binding protein [Catellatospora citrea]|uniref:ATP-binding protein n=1 Tax=Catellatospora citrea TaxID=53366 RepID=UPI0033DB5B0A